MKILLSYKFPIHNPLNNYIISIKKEKKDRSPDFFPFPNERSLSKLVETWPNRIEDRSRIERFVPRFRILACDSLPRRPPDR